MCRKPITKRGRYASETKSRVVIATEILENWKMENAYARIVHDFSSKSLIKIFNDHMDKEPSIKTDKWTGCRLIK